MPIILSLSQYGNDFWAAGPEGLFQVDGEHLTIVAQPQQELACCAVTDTNVLVGGAPHGAAFTPDNGAFWQASWMDGISGPVLCMAVDPRVDETGVVLAGSAEGGILRSQNRGRSWNVCNFGLQDYTIIALAWAPPPPAHHWPRWDVVFAGSENGLYRSPNGGLGWRRVDDLDVVAQAIAVSPDFHADEQVLVGTEETGLWRSSDGGRSFTHVDGAPARVDALVSTDSGWLLSDDQQLWRSVDGISWSQIDHSRPALFLLAGNDEVWAGGEDGLVRIA